MGSILQAEMDVEVQTDSDNLNLKTNPTSTIRDLKELIEKELYIRPERQNIYLLGYKISDDGLLVENMLKYLGTDLPPALTLVLPKAGKYHTFFSEREVFIITGNRRSFQSKVLRKQTKQTMKLNSPLFSRTKQFAIAYRIEGDEPGKRIFHATSYCTNVRDGSIEIESTENPEDAFRVHLVNADGKTEDLVGETKVYNEEEVNRNPRTA